MNKYAFLIAFSILLICTNCQKKSDSSTYSWKDNYTKSEHYIEMRDGVKLFTAIYSPKDKSKDYPVLLKRTPYSCQPYGEDTLPARLHPNMELVKSGYIFVFQDVRGRWMSEGQYENTKPPYSLSDSTKTDELTDSWDTFEWLENNLSNYNGNAGVYGTSYPGWQTLVAARSNHPSIKAVIAAAPVTNFYFDDFNRYGMFALNYLPVVSLFGTPRPNPVDTAWWPDHSELYGLEGRHQPDYYQFFLDRMALSNFDDILDSTDFFWKNIKNHPHYDDFRKSRDWAQYYNDIECDVMVVGGWNDEQNLYGILNSYQHLEKHSPGANPKLVLGPWSHGHTSRGDSAYYLGDVFYGYNLSTAYMSEIEFPYFEGHLKDKEKPDRDKVQLFDTGNKKWNYFTQFPITNDTLKFYLENGKLAESEPSGISSFESFISDPFHPVPFIEADNFTMMAPKYYVTADQRFAGKRPDVLTFSSDILSEDVTVLGKVKALIDFMTNKEDADLFIKLIDVYPLDRLAKPTDKEGVKYSGYQQLVRCGFIRGRYRNGFEKAEPISPNELTQIDVPFLEVYYTFKKGHRIMIQIQSSLFPLYDLNPQNFVPSIYEATKSDFEKAEHKVFNSSTIQLPVTKIIN